MHSILQLQGWGLRCPIPFAGSDQPQLPAADCLNAPRQACPSAPSSLAMQAGSSSESVFERPASCGPVNLKRARSFSSFAVIAGDGPHYRAELEAFETRTLGIENRVILARLARRTFATSISVWRRTCSTPIGMPFARGPVEALALGTPVVASVERGGLNEVICDDRYGFPPTSTTSRG